MFKYSKWIWALFILFCSSAYSQDDNSENTSKTTYDTLTGIEYDPLVNFLRYVNHIRKSEETDTSKKWDCLIRSGQNYDTMRVEIFTRKDKAYYSYRRVSGGLRGSEVFTEYELDGTLILSDSLFFNHEGRKYKVWLYKLFEDSVSITLYYSDTLGVIKQYSSNDYFTFEYESRESGLMTAHLKSIYLNPRFHQRFDVGARTISFLLVDYCKIYGKRKKKIKKEIDLRYKKNGLSTPCETGYLDSCY